MAPQGQGQVAPQAGPPAQPVATPQAAVAAPAAPAPPAQGASPDADFWKAKAAALETDVRRLKSSYDTRLNATQTELQRIRAQQQVVEQQQVAQLPDEQKLQYEHAKMQQELEQTRQALAEKTAQEAALGNYMQTRARYASYGVPYEVLDQRSDSPQAMEEAAFTYLRNLTAGQPAPQAPQYQSQPQQAWSPPTTSQQPVRQATAVHPTSHTAPAATSIETDLQDLAEITRTQRKDTVYEALKRLEQEVPHR